MDPQLVVWGITIALGAIYWWQLKVASVVGASGAGQSFSCLISAGMSNCPFHAASNLQNENWFASALFYAGLLMLLYTLFFPKPPRAPPSIL